MKILFLGDSITEGVGASSQERNYVSLLTNLLKAEFLNFGVSGTRIARQNDLYLNTASYNYDFNMRLDVMPKEADLIICFGGTNDFGHGSAPLGNKFNKDLYTFKGALNVLFAKLVKKYGKEKVLIVLPLPRWDEKIDKVNPLEPNNKDSLTLSTYVENIICCAKKHHLHYVDFRKDFGVPQNNENKGFFIDGLHPNDEGHKLLANLLFKEIKNKYHN